MNNRRIRQILDRLTEESEQCRYIARQFSGGERTYLIERAEFFERQAVGIRTYVAAPTPQILNGQSDDGLTQLPVPAAAPMPKAGLDISDKEAHEVGYVCMAAMVNDHTHEWACVKLVNTLKCTMGRASDLIAHFETTTKNTLRR